MLASGRSLLRRSAAGVAGRAAVAAARQSGRSFSVVEQVFDPQRTYTRPRTLLRVETLYMRNQPGQLLELLAQFSDNKVNLTSIESKLNTFAHDSPIFHIDVEGEPDSPAIQQAVARLREVGARADILPPRQVPWFPVNIRDLDLTRETLDAETDLINEEHPGFHDKEYRARRAHLTEVAQTYCHGSQIPRVEYTADETKTWGLVYSRLMNMSEQYACKEYREIMPAMEKYCGFAANNIPQLQDISDYLAQTTGFTLRPVQGLLSARDFLNALAFRVFFSTQYIRHHGNPFYTPEPDICHELVGHVPMFADPSFAEFSHKIGLASLAASDEDIDRLASCYWFTVEFGVLREEGAVKAYGAGLLSSFGEMEWACAEQPSVECRESGGMIQHHPDLLKPELRPFDPNEAAVQPFPITTYQPVLYCADSLKDAKNRMDAFCDSLNRPFFPQYDPLTQSIVVSKSVERMPRTTTLHLQAQKQKDYFDSLGREGPSAKIAGHTEEDAKDATA